MCHLPLHPISFDLSWMHLDNVCLADPYFSQPGKIDLLLRLDVYVQALLARKLVHLKRAVDKTGTEIEGIYLKSLMTPTLLQHYNDYIAD